MDRPSRKELLLTVERQEEQLKRYETRLRDVVQAYKGLQKEKIALEKSLKVLGPSSKTSVESNSSNDREKLLSEEQTRDQATPGDGTAKVGAHSSSNQPVNSLGQSLEGSRTQDSKDGSDSSATANLQAQVKTLREALETMMEQKSKMESSFQADKKKYLQELQKKEETFAIDRDEFCQVKESMQKEIQDLRNRTRQEQQARESEQNDHAMMLRELQVVLSKERASKEGLQSKLDSLNKILAAKQAQLSHDSPTKSEVNTQKVTVLSDETEDSKENVESKSSITLLQLQQEMVKMKSELTKNILSEQLRANEAEAKASMIARAEEQRVADLEAKLSELSEVVGKYERLRSHDQSEIQKLKERLHHLNSTNKETLNTDNRDLENKPTFDNESNIEEVFRKVKDLLRSHCQGNEDIFESDVAGFSKAELEYILKNDPAHRACQEELRQLKDEFERYKSKAQTIRKAKLENEECSNENVDKLHRRIASLQSATDSLQRELDSSETERRLDRDNSLREITELRVKHNLELENERTIYAAKLQELENQVRNQRSRTLSLISEKDCEIERLKDKLKESSPSTSTEIKMKRELQRRSSNSDAAVKELLSQPSPSTLVHYAQEQAFCEAELGVLRKQRLELEDSLREAHHREEQAAEQIQFLKEEIRKLERNRSRENANLEYVKNVILRYLLTDSDSVRQQMVAAISAILEFSPKEEKQLYEDLLRLAL